MEINPTSESGRKRKREELWNEENIFGEARDDAEEDEAEEVESMYKLETTQDGRKKRLVTKSPQPQKDEKLAAKLLSVLDALEESADMDGRSRSALFITLPSKRFYPDYYQIIKKPIDLTTIRKRVKRGIYQTIDEFQDDITLLFNNARTYNIEGSQVYTDAIFLAVSIIFSIFFFISYHSYRYFIRNYVKTKLRI